MTMEDYNRLKTIVDAELTLTQDNVLQKSLNIPFLYHKYLDIFINETREYKTLKQKVKKKYSDVYADVKFKGNFQLDSKAEVEVFIAKDDVYMDLKHEADMQETVVQYLELLLDTISKMSFHIKNFVDIAKFKSGQ